MNKTQKIVWEALCSLSGEQVANILTDIHGLQILDDNVKQELIDLGIVEN